MKMIDRMGLRPPQRWKEQIQKNQILKTDIRQQINKSQLSLSHKIQSEQPEPEITIDKYFDDRLP